MKKVRTTKNSMEAISTVHVKSVNLSIYIQRFALFVVILTLTSVLVLFLVTSEGDEKNSSAAVSDRLLIIAAKRFITYFYSVNSDAVREEQYAALDMMVDKKLKEERLAWLKRTNHIQRTEKAIPQMLSNFEWNNAKVNVTRRYLDQPLLVEGSSSNFFVSDYYEIEIMVRLVVNNGRSANIHIFLSMIPQPYSNENPHQAGVIGIRDAAKEPLVD